MHKKDVNDYYIDEGRPFKWCVFAHISVKIYSSLLLKSSFKQDFMDFIHLGHSFSLFALA